jgi:hypothetical protein
MIIQSQETILSYYAQSGRIYDPGKYTESLLSLGGDVQHLVETVQGLVLHIFWAQQYGVKLTDERKSEVQIRRVEPKLDRILQMDPRPFSAARQPELRLTGNCRDFSVLLAALLKIQGIPARARCGFGTYFIPGHYEDHWMTEYWLESESRWVQVDAQLDALQKQAMGISFNSLDMPHGQFVLAGEAWQMCREGRANPEDFGIFDMKGIDFIYGNLMRDFLSLNQLPVLPWDAWNATAVPAAQFTQAQLERADQVAQLTLGGNERFGEVRDLYEQNPVYHIPAEW